MAETASPARTHAGSGTGTPLGRRRIVREAVVAGLLGAAAVAIWFLLLDLLRGQPFFTPAALGSALFDGARGVAEVDMGFRTVAVANLLGATAVLGYLWRVHPRLHRSLGRPLEDRE
jgi:hypothetical protein